MKSRLFLTITLSSVLIVCFSDLFSQNSLYHKQVIHIEADSNHTFRTSREIAVLPLALNPLQSGIVIGPIAISPDEIWVSLVIESTGINVSYSYYSGNEWSKYTAWEEDTHLSASFEDHNFFPPLHFAADSIKIMVSGARLNEVREISIRGFEYQGNSMATDLSDASIPHRENNACPCPSFPKVNRSLWGSQFGLNESSSCSSPAFTTVTHAIIHHSATSNNSQYWPGQVAAIYDFHTTPNGQGGAGFCDIGYNYLVDPNGFVYIGRGGGDGVIGAHMCGNNSNTMGVCVLGTFNNISPTEDALAGLVLLLGEKFCQFNIDPQGASFINNDGPSLIMENISGHLDGCSFGYTVCPGNQLYSQLDLIRATTEAYIESCGSNNEEDITLESPSLSENTVCPGESITASVQMCYSGTQLDADLPSFNLLYLFSSDCTLDIGEDEVLGSDSSGLGSDDECNSENANLTIDASTPPGNYYILFYADSDNELDESNEANNVICLPITVSDCNQPADIYLNNVFVDQNSVCPDESISVSASVCYEGNQNSSNVPNVLLEFYLSSDCQLNTIQDTYLGSDVSDVGSDNPCADEVEGVLIPADTPPGNYFVIFFADANNQISESSEGNNTFCYPITILDCSCGNPSGLAVVTNTTTSANLDWSNVSNATSYDVLIQTCGSVEWTEVANVSSSNATIGNLLCGTCYNWRIRANCSQGDSSPMVIGPTFETDPCPCSAPDNLINNTIESNSISIDWSDESEAISYLVQYKQCDQEIWTNSITFNSSDGTITNLECDVCYNWRVRSNCTSGTSSFVEGSSYTTLTCSCEAPSDGVVSNVTTNSANLNWTQSADGSQFNVQLRACGTMNWSESFSATGSSLSIESLDCAQCYEWRVQTVCSNNTLSEFILGSEFVTLVCECQIPTDLSSFNVTANSAQLDWSTIPNADGYIVQFKCCHETSWEQFSEIIEFSEFQLEDILCNSCYNWRVRQNCSESDWSEDDEFFTTSSIDCEETCLSVGIENLEARPNIVIWFESGTFIVNNTSNQAGTVSIYNSNGQLLCQDQSIAFNRQVISCSERVLSAGLYIAHFQYLTGSSISKVLVIE